MIKVLTIFKLCANIGKVVDHGGFLILDLVEGFRKRDLVCSIGFATVVVVAKGHRSLGVANPIGKMICLRLKLVVVLDLQAVVFCLVVVLVYLQAA